MAMPFPSTEAPTEVRLDNLPTFDDLERLSIGEIADMPAALLLALQDEAAAESARVKRLKDRFEDGRKLWKLSPMDLKSYSRWYDYSRARDAMFAETDTEFAPWYVAPSDDKKKVRLNIITHILSKVPYEALPQDKPKLPARQKAGDYQESDRPMRTIPQAY